MTTGLAGRVAVITASSRGMGRGIAEHFLKAGASVMISGRTPESGVKALAELGAGERAVAIACDARSRAQVDALVDATVQNFGRLDILVNCAGGSDGFALIHEMTDDAWSNAMDFVLNSAFWATRRALPHMIDGGYGRVINISSVEGKQGNKANIAHYIAAKHGLNGLTKATAFEYGKLGVTCNAICPGAVETETFAENGAKYAEQVGFSYGEFRDLFVKESAIGRLNTVDEVAALALLLAGELGGGINGTMINVDGGSVPY